MTGSLLPILEERGRKKEPIEIPTTNTDTTIGWSFSSGSLTQTVYNLAPKTGSERRKNKICTRKRGTREDGNRIIHAVKSSALKLRQAGML